jgi:glycogen synthase
MNTRKIRLAYLSGPVDAAEVYERWKSGQHTKLFGTSYLMQFYELCSELDAEALVITTLPGEFSRRNIGQVTIENRPPSRSGGLRYHLAMIASMLALGPTLVRFKPSALVITAHQNYWFVLIYAKLLGTEIIPSAHCVMWRPYASIPRHLHLLLWLNGLFLRLSVRRAMAISGVVASQLKKLAKSDRFEVEVVTPTYAADHFDTISPADHARRPFGVLFNGRVEANKGVFDLLEIADRLNSERPGEFRFDVCGDGSQEQVLVAAIQQRGLEETVKVFGFCDKDQLSRLLASSHVVIVPTRSDFEEGLAKTCVEAVLAGRPFVTSPVCPALESLGDAGLGVPPDDVKAYGDALLKLADDSALYNSKARNCVPLQAQFYDASRAYKAVLRRQLVATGIIDRQMLGAPARDV